MFHLRPRTLGEPLEIPGGPPVVHSEESVWTHHVKIAILATEIYGLVKRNVQKI